ncbi:hypothetical protein EV363DRAFT_1150239 [Boletus edulis]|nr:hypothetical protein EV363DRAFT_1150239 [Boletus edulis]
MTPSVHCEPAIEATPSSSSHNVPFTKPADSPVAPCETENSLHGVPRSEAPAKPVMQPQGFENPTIPPQLGHDRVPYPPGYMKPVVQPQGFENPTIPPQLGHDHVPYPPGWFGPPGTGPRFRGYPGPFFGPYGGWGMFPDMNPSDAGPSVLPAGSEGQLENVASFDPTAFFKLYGQHFMYPNGFVPGNTSGPGTSEGGQAAQSQSGEAAGSDAK